MVRAGVPITLRDILSRPVMWKDRDFMCAKAVQKQRTEIRETPGINGGYPRIGDTRIAVRTIVERYRATGSVEETMCAFSQLTREQIEAALAYYREHPARIDEDIARNARTWAELTAR